MIIVFKKGASEEEIQHVIDKVEKLGLTTMVSKGVERTIVGIIGPEETARLQPHPKA